MRTDEPDHVPLRTQLDPARFEVIHDVPIFDEHEVEEPKHDENGKVVGTKKLKYTRRVLEAIAKNMNKRIEDTGDYTALCLGHTPTPEQRRIGVPQPPLVGFAGPYYVGTIGEKNPRPAIIAKNWAIFRDEVDRVRKHPRRSVEVWREANPYDRYIEPIALLGAETPRRDLGLAYSRIHEGVQVERYACAAPAGPMAPSATNTTIPGSKPRNKNKDTVRYEDGEHDQPSATVKAVRGKVNCPGCGQSSKGPGGDETKWWCVNCGNWHPAESLKGGDSKARNEHTEDPDDLDGSNEDNAATKERYEDGEDYIGKDLPTTKMKAVDGYKDSGTKIMTKGGQTAGSLPCPSCGDHVTHKGSNESGFACNNCGASHTAHELFVGKKAGQRRKPTTTGKYAAEEQHSMADDPQVPVEQYEYGQPGGWATSDQPGKIGTGQLTDESINQIVQAISQLDFAKWAMEQMEASQAKAPDTVVDPAMMGEDPNAVGVPGMEAGMPGMEDPNALGVEPGGMPSDGMPDVGQGAPDIPGGPDESQPSQEQDAQMSNEPQGNVPENENTHYAAEGTVDRGNEYSPEAVAQYALQERYAAIEKYNEQLAERLKAIEDRAVHAERYAEIASWKEHYLFDEQAERARAEKYSAEQWEEHRSVVENYARNPANFASMPLVAPRKSGVVSENATKELYSKINERAEQYLSAGKFKSYAEIEAEVKAELGQ